MEWNSDMSQAPKDGTEFLSFAPGNSGAMYERDRDPVWVVTKWKNGVLWHNRPDNPPTHWMPLPEPPSTPPRDGVEWGHDPKQATVCKYGLSGAGFDWE